MTDEISGQQPTKDLNVTTDEKEIYQGGKLSGITVADLLNNEIALRMVLNELNVSRRDYGALECEAESLRLEKAADSRNLITLSIISALNLLGVVVVGIGVNFVTSSTPPNGAAWILLVGILVSLICAIAPPVLTARRQAKGKGDSNAN